MTPRILRWPHAALDRPAAIVGTTGSGKTFAAKGAVEALLLTGRRVCVVDPTGVWYGLRAGAPGTTSTGFPVVIFGGDHADIPIDETSGERLARLVAERDVPAVVDISEMGIGERTRFLTAFLTELYVANKRALHLVLDEADEMAPQRPMPETTRLLSAVDRIVRRGRTRGFRPMMITQRPAVIHKNVLSQIATLVAMKLTSPQDRAAVEAWVQGNADAGQAKEVIGSLASLKVGEGWLWSPADGVLERGRFAPIQTADTSRTPDHDEDAAVPGQLSRVDVGELRDALGADAPAPRGTGKAGATPAPRDQVTAAAIRQARDDGYAAGLRDGIEQGRSATLQFIAGKIADVIGQAEKLGARGSPAERPAEVPPPEVRGDMLVEHTSPKHVRITPIPDERGLAGAARKLFAVLDTNPPIRRSWAQVATLAGLKARGGHYNAGRKALLEGGFVVEDGGLVRVAQPSAAAAAPVSDPAAVVEMWAGSLSGAAPKILRHLFGAGPTTRADVAAALGMQPRGGHWNAAWKELRDNAIVEESGGTVGLSELFRPVEQPASRAKARGGK